MKNILLLFILLISLNFFSQITNSFKNPCLSKSFCDDTCTIYFNLGYDKGSEAYAHVYMIPNIHFQISKNYQIIKNNEAKNSLLIRLIIFNDSCFVEKIEVVKSENKQMKNKIELYFKEKITKNQFVIDQKDIRLIQKNKKYFFNLLIGIQPK